MGNFILIGIPQLRKCIMRVSPNIIRGASRYLYGALAEIIRGPPINIWGILLFTGVPQLQKYIVPVILGPPYVTEKPDTLQWRHNGCNSVSNIQPHDCLLNRLFTGRITGPLSCLCGEFADHQFVRDFTGDPDRWIPRTHMTKDQ